MATGVLPVFVGRATKACDIIPDRRKVYTAGFQLGVSTDTLDSTGKTLKQATRQLPEPTLNVQKQFCRRYHAGAAYVFCNKSERQKLYELARAGKEIEREPRAVHIDSIDIIEYDEASRRGVMKVDCEKVLIYAPLSAT